MILISLDGMRADRTSAYGNRNQTTPTLHRLATEGIRWEYAFSQSNESLFSHAAMLTGRQVPELGLPDYRSFTLPADALLLGEVLSAHGYSTAAFVAGGHVHAGYGFDQGFGTFDHSHDFGAFFHKAPQALDWLDAEARQPFFLFLHGYDCHRPYVHTGPFTHPFDRDYDGRVHDLLGGQAAVERVFQGVFYPDFPIDQFEHPAGDPIVDPQGYLRIERWAEEHEGVALSDRDLQHLVAHYDGGVLAADLRVGLFLEELEQQGLLDNALVVLTADHGEDLHDHGFFNHRALLRDSTTRVPLVLWGPALGSQRAGTVRGDLAQAIDLLPTILGVVGATAPARLAGRDLLQRQDLPQRVFQIGVLPEVSVRTPAHRLVFRGVPLSSPHFHQALALAPLEPPWFALFDLREDPGEHDDLVQAQPQLAEGLRQELLSWSAELERGGHRGQQPLDPALREVLRSRGYW